MVWEAEQTSSGEILYYVFTDKDALLIASSGGDVAVGAIATVTGEPGNKYIMGNNSKWIVCSGNGYPTINLPSNVDFEIPMYTQIIDRTTGDVHYEDGL